MDSSENLDELYRKITEKYEGELGFYRSLIDIMHQIRDDALKKFANIARSTGRKKEGVPVLLDVFEARILHSFVGNYTLIKSGVIIDSYGSLRTIYENILRTYAVCCLPEIGEAASHYYFGLDDEQARRYQNEFERLRHRVLMKKLYKAGLNASCRAFYEIISGKTHTTVKGMAGLFTIREQDYIDSLKTGIGLAYANLVLLSELYGDIIDAKHRGILLTMLPEGEKFILEGIPLLIPDSEGCLPKLKIKKYEEFTQSLQLQKAL